MKSLPCTLAASFILTTPGVAQEQHNPPLNFNRTSPSASATANPFAQNLYIVTNSGLTFVAKFASVPNGVSSQQQCQNAKASIWAQGNFATYISEGTNDTYLAAICVDSEYTQSSTPSNDLGRSGTRRRIR